MTQNSAHLDIISELLEPNSPHSPTGIDVTNAEEYFQLEMEMTKMTPDYAKCAELATKLLREQGKHLRVIVYLCFAWYRIEKLVGLENGLTLFLQVLQKFGATLYPQDQFNKSKAIQFLNSDRVIKLLERETIRREDAQIAIKLETLAHQISSELDKLLPTHSPHLISFNLVSFNQIIEAKSKVAKQLLGTLGGPAGGSKAGRDPLPDPGGLKAGGYTLPAGEAGGSGKGNLPAGETGGDAVHRGGIHKEDVLFTLYHPKEAMVESWYSMLVYVHLQSALQDVQLDAKKFANEMNDDPRAVSSKKPTRLARGTKIRLVPQAEGVEFNPPEQSLIWLEDFHRVNFRFHASRDLINQPCFGEITVYVDPIQIAHIRFSIFIVDASVTSIKKPSAAGIKAQSAASTMSQAKMYRKIFASYSHRDTEVVKACTTSFKALGDEIYIDYETLRSGENWNQALMELIAAADIFQLFWSANAANSNYVEQEWRHALEQLKIKREQAFIRPVYWEQPMPNVPAELGHLHFKFLPEMAFSKK